ncbi:MAG: hypothetical protein WBB24_12380 [Maribacter sp.]
MKYEKFKKGKLLRSSKLPKRIQWNCIVPICYTVDKTEWHRHENPYFMYVLQGNMLDCNRRTETLCPLGSLMFNNWQEPHFISKHSCRANGFHLEFQKHWFKNNGMNLDILEGSRLTSHFTIL